MSRGVHIVCHACEHELLLTPDNTDGDLDDLAQRAVDNHETRYPSHETSHAEVSLQ